MNKSNKSAEEKMADNLKIVLSQYMSDHKSFAVKRGMLNRAKSGYAVTRPPLGYSKTETVGLYELDSYGLAIRNALNGLANNEADTGTALAYIEMMFHVMTQTKWPTHAVIMHLLEDPYYAGFISYKGELYQGLHEPLITEELHHKLLAYLESIVEEDNPLESLDKSL